MRKGRAVRKFLGDGKRGLLERLVGDDEVDEPPALERRGIVAACEHRHLLRARHARALDLALDPAHQRVEAERRLDRADLRRLGGDDIVARERELEAAAKTDAMNAARKST